MKKKNKSSSRPNLLFFSGCAPTRWNHSMAIKKPLGGSERAVAFLAEEFARLHYQVYVLGYVEPEISRAGVRYVRRQDRDELETITWDVIIISRYIEFFQWYPRLSARRVYLWIHDRTFHPTIGQLESYFPKISGHVLCLTQWHKKEIETRYLIKPQTIRVLGNGIPLDLIPALPLENPKIRHRFLFTSTPSRGLGRILELWPKILQTFPEATLRFCTYDSFPKTEEDHRLYSTVLTFPDTITFLGSLSPKQLYQEMIMADMWFYPCTKWETFCITALEMLACGVLCIYYPVSGLTETMNGHGLEVSVDNEVEEMYQWRKEEEPMAQVRKKGMIYARSCGWNHRVKDWERLCFGGEKKM